MNNLRLKSYPRFDEFLLPKEMNSSDSLLPFVAKIGLILNFSSGFSFISGLTTKSKKAYPFEIYLLNMGASFETGLYHYYARNHSLEKLINYRKSLLKTSLILPENCGCILIVTCILNRISNPQWNKRDKSFLSAKHDLIGRINQISSSLDFRTRGLKYSKDKLQELMDIDEDEEKIFAVIGLDNHLDKK